MNRKFTKSVVSDGNLVPIFSLGDLYVSDFLKPNENPKYERCKLELAFDPISKSVQLTEQPPLESLWGSFYWYLSATNPAMRAALKNLAEQTINSIPAKLDSVYLDIASNDCTLLSFVPDGFKKIGIDPSKYDIVAGMQGQVIQDYFSKESFYKSGHLKARYISGAAFFYDLDNPIGFLNDVYSILEDDGIFTLQLSYTPLMIQQVEIGNICHEHLCYYNLTSLKYLFDKTGFVIKDVELNNVNGGSIRVYLQKESARNFRSPADADICRIRIQSLLDWEESAGYNDIGIYESFFAKINRLKRKTIDFIVTEKYRGKKIYGYGASTKASTLYQYFQLDNELIDKIAEKQERKVGLKTIGTNIPIISDEEMRGDQPDYLLVGPWFFLENFKQREKEYLEKGGAFILTSPEFSIYRNV